MENDIKQTENEFVKKALVLAMDNEHSTISVDKINAMYNQLHAAKCYTTRLKNIFLDWWEFMCPNPSSEDVRLRSQYTVELIDGVLKISYQWDEFPKLRDTVDNLTVKLRTQIIQCEQVDKNDIGLFCSLCAELKALESRLAVCND